MSGLDLLEKRIKASAIQAFVIAGCTRVMGLGLLAGAVYQLASGELNSGGFMGLMGLGSVGVAWMLGSGGRAMLPAKGTALYKAFESEPHRITWAYLRVGKTNGIQIVLDNGDPETLHANRADSQALLRLVQERAPQAILGWGPEQKQRFAERMKAARAAR